MPVSSEFDSDAVVRLSITSGGAPLAAAARVISVIVSGAVGEIPSARLVIEDADPAAGAWSLADAKTFEPGATIAIGAGYGEREDVIFEGVVVGLGVRSEGAGRLVVECRDRAVRMTVGDRNAVYGGETDSAIIARLARAHGLEVRVDATSTVHAALAQVGCSDWDFLVSRAAKNGLLVIARTGVLAVEAPRVSGQASLTTGWGVDLIRLEADIDGRTQPEPVQATTWDPGTQSAVRGAPAGQAQQARAGLARVRGRMAFRGDAKAKVGEWIEVQGLGARFSGDVFVSGLTHTIADGEWTTEVTFGLPPDPVRDGSALRHVVTPTGLDGLHIGVVTERRDPEGAHRLRVRIPLLDPDAEVWARLSQTQASTSFGAVMVPDVGDEVILGFFGGDPAAPVILGGLYSRARPPPYAAGDGVIGLVTRGLARVEIDESGQLITVTTRGNNRVVLNDEDGSVRLQDQHGNVVALGAGGIALVSSGDIDIAAKGGLSLKAAGVIAVAAASDVTMEGLNVSCDAKGSFTARGAAAAELSAAGQTTVKGALVMIN